MPTLFIMNAATEQMLGHSLSSADIQAAINSAWRNIWLANEGDVVVLPKALEPEIKAYVGEVLQCEPDKVIFIAPDVASVLTDSVLREPHLRAKIQPYIEHDTVWTVNPCYQSVGVAELADSLGLSLGEGDSFIRQQGIDRYNRKSQFRTLATQSSLPVPSGEILHSKTELAGAIQRHIDETGIVIIKSDVGVAGLGNIAITRHPLRPLPGISRLYSESDFDLDSLQIDNTVVESYHTATHMLFIEFFVQDDGRADFLNLGEIRMVDDSSGLSMKWIGLDLHTSLPPLMLAHYVNESSRFVQAAAKRGYRGYIDVDAIVTDRHQLLFNESNGRWGGCTVLHHLAEKLIGRNYASTHVVSARRAINTPSFEYAKSILEKTERGFCPIKQEGIVILAFDKGSQQMEIVLIARSLGTARTMEQQYLKALTE
ncbi:hypothetical protein [Photobacterium sp. 1_MG-2023]|uniref:preATP grasp domain-containing protein n=1 Tax=Photobacterium sp. 1_MG-2023 TaxID=3062646 RepID=UPI0026E28BB8|nr:hypothetical protein [Photobacterium sp. 1_MG-2023]MDO6706331.1 hypothetical protein [Photobacterium sp. 1_MG-2023]